MFSGKKKKSNKKNSAAILIVFLDITAFPHKNLCLSLGNKKD